MINKKIGIIGCGNMGEAILDRLVGALERSTMIMVSEYDARRRDYLQSKYKMIIEMDNDRLVKFADVIIAAVKPKDFKALLEDEICCCLDGSKLFISIAAGITTKYVEGIIGENMPVIRVMPNMPAMVGKGISSITRGKYASDEHVKIAREIFGLVGEVVEVGEDMVDAVTAVSGSGPAYFFYFIESMIESAKELGFDDAGAGKLVLETFYGAAKLLEVTGQDPIDLRRKVTSKGGTTEAAIVSMEAKGFKDIVKAAMKSARDRAVEISAK